MTPSKARRQALRVLLAAHRHSLSVEVATVTLPYYPGSPGGAVDVKVARWLRDNGHVVTNTVDVLDLAADMTRRVTIELTTKGLRLAERWEGST